MTANKDIICAVSGEPAGGRMQMRECINMPIQGGHLHICNGLRCLTDNLTHDQCTSKTC